MTVEGRARSVRFIVVMSSIFTALMMFAATASGATEITPEAVIAEMNARRANIGLSPLRLDLRLMGAAEDRMRDMEELEYWAHTAPDGRSPFSWIRPRGYEFAYAGENLAAGFETAEVLVDGWMESKGHRENILSPFFRDCGVAVIEGSTTGKSSGKSVVVMFGASLATKR